MATDAVNNNQSYYQMAANVTDMENQLNEWNNTLANLKASPTPNNDEIGQAQQMLTTLGSRLVVMNQNLQQLQSNTPKLVPPASETQAQTAMAVGANPWLVPSSIVAFIVVMQQVLQESKQFSFLESQLEVKGMGQTLTLGQQQSQLEIKQGQTEAMKSYVQAGMEGANALTQFGGVGMRVTSSSRKNQAQKDLDTKETNDLAANAKLQKAADDKIALNEGIVNNTSKNKVGSSAAAVHAQATPKEKAAAQKELDAATNEKADLVKDAQNIKDRHEQQNSEIERQKSVTLEQAFRGADHAFSAAGQVVNGVYTQQVKTLEAEITMTRTYMEILKTYMGSASKAASEGRDWAKGAADSMNQAFAQKTQMWQGPH